MKIRHDILIQTYKVTIRIDESELHEIIEEYIKKKKQTEELKRLAFVTREMELQDMKTEIYESPDHEHFALVTLDFSQVTEETQDFER